MNSEFSVGDACGGNGVVGTACLNQFVNDSATIDGLYPFVAGFSEVGSSVNTYMTMRDNDCLGTMNGYYAIDMNKFAKIDDYKCSGTMTPYKILNDCQNIDMSVMDASDVRSPLHPDNYMCAVLCDAGFVYTGSGACSQYCNVDGTIRRFHAQYGDTHIEIPLYSDALTTPAIHIRFSDKQVCHMNLTTEKQTDALNVLYQNTLYYSTK